MTQLTELPEPQRSQLLSLAKTDSLLQAGLALYEQGAEPLNLLLALVLQMGERHKSLLAALEQVA